MTYESLMIANQTITKIEVKGKEYAEVNQRIRVFRMLYPNGSIETNIESLEKGICVMSAVVKDDFGSVLGVGHTYNTEEMARLIGGMITMCKEAGIPDREIATPEEKRLLKERYGVDV